MPKKKQQSIGFDPLLFQEGQAQAAREGCSFSELVRRSLWRYLETRPYALDLTVMMRRLGLTGDVSDLLDKEQAQ